MLCQGFMVGRKYEAGGIAKDGAKMVMAVANAQARAAHTQSMERASEQSVSGGHPEPAVPIYQGLLSIAVLPVMPRVGPRSGEKGA